MVSLKGEHIYLRALEPEDLNLVYDIENDMGFWELSDAQAPYSQFVIKQYLEHAKTDIYEAKQLRLVICSNADEPLGLIDLFDFDFKNKRAGVGIIIKDIKNRNKGFGAEAIELLSEYSFKVLHLHQLYANIDCNNSNSLKLFMGQGFTEVGIKKDWRFDGKAYHHVYLLQKIMT
ncbi:GNAT family N-acetyltransferase [Winogradskyella sp. DF17]|uniref:GNAT family N-acetyltransferase n=1 Tax=Winogradskyella pelagia TaxID=2819984 RepID=A0ABS3T3L0_9FLAO|nr:GNAT family N-acetyltransferase [Winogradskyella sp. DF17]MBO3117332.1 GNAT family N-acetyltransferase [Winogradskyella sp. DF17]